jgi:hypothetical protein
MKVAAINGRSKNETSTPQKDNNIDIKLKQSKGDQTNYCSKCKKGINHFETNEEITENHQKSSFTIQSNQSGDVQKLRAEATMLNEEARALKHEGNRKGASENGAKGQLAQAHYYLKSSAKFLQHALKLADVKVAYKEIGDSQHARTYGDYSVTTLAQTSSLIESTMRTFQNARNVKLLALSCKFSAVVHLAIYRFQHIKLFSLYTDLFSPDRSPDSRPNGTPTIITTGGNDKDTAIRTHLLKEIEHVFRGYEMWRRYESYNINVLPRITDPSIANFTILLEDLEKELETTSSC